MAFYMFRQNNSGGSFHYRHGIGVEVLVEANSPTEANERAQKVGIYFGGSGDDGPDCPCCGDRWYPANNYKSCVNDAPHSYGEPLVNPIVDNENPDVWVHYADGRVVGLRECKTAPEGTTLH